MSRRHLDASPRGLVTLRPPAHAYTGARRIAYPIFQASLVMAGLLGIVAFNEIVGFASISAFFVSAAVVVGGSVLLAAYGPV